jgi:hypothetical protein
MNRTFVSTAIAIASLAAANLVHAQDPTQQPAPQQGPFQINTHISAVKCPSLWPVYVPRDQNNSHHEARDLCTKHGVTLPPNLIPGDNLTEGREYVRLPVSGVYLGYSFVANDAHVTPADGWKLVVNKFGKFDRYER